MNLSTSQILDSSLQSLKKTNECRTCTCAGEELIWSGSADEMTETILGWALKKEFQAVATGINVRKFDQKPI